MNTFYYIELSRSANRYAEKHYKQRSRVVLTRLLPGLDWSDVERCSAECSDLLKSWPPRRSPASNGEVGHCPKECGQRGALLPSPSLGGVQGGSWDAPSKRAAGPLLRPCQNGGRWRKWMRRMRSAPGWLWLRLLRRPQKAVGVTPDCWEASWRCKCWWQSMAMVFFAWRWGHEWEIRTVAQCGSGQGVATLAANVAPMLEQGSRPTCGALPDRSWGSIARLRGRCL